MCPEGGDAGSNRVNSFWLVEHAAGGIEILLTEALDGVGILQLVDSEDVESPDGRVKVSEVVVDLLRHLAMPLVER